MTYFYEVRETFGERSENLSRFKCGKKADGKKYIHLSHLFHIPGINCNFGRINPNMINNKFSFIYFYFFVMKSNGKWRSFWFYYGGFMWKLMLNYHLIYSASREHYSAHLFYLSGIAREKPLSETCLRGKKRWQRCSKLAKHIFYLPMFKSSQQTWLLSKIAF